jgi:hypothetical protein
VLEEMVGVRKGEGKRRGLVRNRICVVKGIIGMLFLMSIHYGSESEGPL